MQTRRMKSPPRLLKVAAIIPNYNMPERADALANYLNKIACVDLFLVDNGSDIMPPALHSSVFVHPNAQTTAGWWAGVNAAKKRDDYFAYCFLITSTEFCNCCPDPITLPLAWMVDHEDVVGIHPSLTPDSTTTWVHMINRNSNEPRPVFMVDNICSIYRADWWNENGGFDPELTYAWGVDLEMGYKARMQGKRVCIDDRVLVKKVTDIGYTMGRMGMTGETRRVKARANMEAVLSKKYGGNWWEKMTKTGVTDELQ